MFSLPFFILGEIFLLLWVKVEREELLGSSGANTTRVAMLEGEVAAGGEAEVVAVGASAEARRGEPLLPLQDPWYYSTSLFRTNGAPKVGPPGVPKKWILKGEAPSYEIAWVPITSSVMDLRFQQKELSPVPIQFLCPCGTIVGWSDLLEQEVTDKEFCQILRAIRFLVCHWKLDTHTFFFPWGETTITLEDVERICLLPSMGDVNLLELGLFNEESMIAGKLLETF